MLLVSTIRPATPPSPAGAQTFPWSAIAFAVVLNALWGANVPAVKVALVAVPPLWMGFWRFLLGALCIAAWSLLNGIRMRPPREEWGALALLGVLFTVQIGLMNVGIRFTTGAMASILIATNPLWAALFAHLFVSGDRLNRMRGAGMVLAFAGICAIFLRDAGAFTGQGSTWGNGICLASASLLGGRLIFSARLLQRIESTRVVMWQMIVSLPCFALAGWFTEQVAWERLDWQPLASIAYQGIVVAGFNFMGLAYLLRRYPASVVTGFNFLAPVFGVLLSIGLLAESISWQVGVGLAAVGVGLALIARR